MGKSPDGADPPSPRPRRAKGDGSIRERRPGQWEVRLSITEPDGHPARKSWYAPSQAEAVALLQTKRAERDAGTLQLETPTIGAVLDAWLIHLDERAHPPAGSKRAPTLRSGTLHHYRHYSALIRARLGSVVAATLRTRQVQALVDYYSARGLEPKSVRHVRDTLRAALNYALRQDWIPRNVAAGPLIDLPPMARPAITPLSEAEARHLLVTAAGDRYAALWVLLLACGPRIGEALGLQWADYDPAARTLRIHRQIQREDGALRFAPLKTRQSVRTLDVPATVVLALKAHAVVQAAERDAAGSAWEDWSLIFTTRRGTPLDRAKVWRRLQRLCRTAGLAPRSLHALRHSAATILLERDVQIAIVSKMLGHSQLSTTVDIYSHWTPAMQARVAEVMDEVLRQESGKIRGYNRVQTGPYGVQ